VKEGWIIVMRETTKNSRETTRKKIEAQGKGDANARYGKQQLDQKKITRLQMDKNSHNRPKQKTSNSQETQRPNSDTNVHNQPEPTHSSTPTDMDPLTQQKEGTRNK
jgi:hypothetical protein